MEIFDFCPYSRVAIEMAPEEREPISFNGWQTTVKPTEPYRRTFKVKLSGLRWHLTAKGLDETKNPETNVGRLLSFYRRHRQYKEFWYHHEYLGPIVCRFVSPINPPEAVPDSGGLVEEIEFTMLHSNPRYE